MSAAAASAAPAGELDPSMIAAVTSLSPLELSRLQWKPTLPTVLKKNIQIEKGEWRGGGQTVAQLECN
jgi:hypothetical protein